MAAEPTRRARSSSGPTRAPTRRWSRRVTETSHALDLEPGVFQTRSPRAIAESLKRSADESLR
ncbi:DUF3175 domain-containing protein [Sorangium sp. So ce1000]|uniref:DUF3175 domain-containing protein n=1 Tax=Sorangium sp. So ce1000 TaxID=3133325 RepID=UPI003F644F1F